MQTLLHIAVGNAVVAAAMALLLLPAARWLGRPALTHALSLLILLKLVTPPVVNLPLVWPAPGSAGAAPQASRWARPRPPAPEQAMDLSQTVAVLVPAPEAATPRPPSPSSRAAPPWPPLSSLAARVLSLASSPWVAAAWAGSSALYAAVVLLRIVRLRRAVLRATVPGEDLSQEINRLARQMGLRGAPEVRFVSGLAPPMLLAAFGKACVLVPAALWSRLDAAKRQTLLLHELAHLRRRDHWVRYLELAATCAYWWHPAAWWARSALREAEEQCCDAWVIWAMPGARRTYMTTLLDAVDFISESVRPNSLAAPVLASGMGQFQHLQRRLTMVRERSVQRRLSGGGVAAVVLSALALPLGPRLLRAQDAPPAPPAGDRQQPAIEEKAAAEGGTTDPGADNRQPTSTYEKSGMSRIESLDAQLKAARMQIEALQKELAESKAAWSLPPHTRAVRRDGTVIELEPPRVIVVEPRTATDPVPAPPTPAPRMSIRYSNGKLEAVSIPGEKRVWVTEVGPLGTIESVDGGKIVIQNANGKWYAVATNDGHILEEKPIMVSPDGTIGVTSRFHSTSAKPEAAESLPREAGNASRTENRLDALEKELTQLTKAVDRLANSDGQRAAHAERALKAAEMAARDAEKAASDAKADFNGKIRKWDPRGQSDPSAKPKDDEKSAPGEQLR